MVLLQQKISTKKQKVENRSIHTSKRISSHSPSLSTPGGTREMLSFEISDLDAMQWEGGSAASERSATLQREKSSKIKSPHLALFHT